MKLTESQLRKFIKQTINESFDDDQEGDSFEQRVFDAFDRLIGAGSEVEPDEAADVIAADLGVDREAVYDVLLRDQEEFDSSLSENRKITKTQLKSLIKETLESSNGDFYASVVGDGGFINKNLQKPAKVRIVDLDVIGVNKNDPEVRVYFDTSTWNTKMSGLIYGDSRFLNDVKKKARELNPKIKDLDYSEHGMQGNDYVSFDAIFESATLRTEGKLDFTFEELYDRLVDTLFELEDRFNQDPERISRQACRTIELMKKDDVPITTFPKRRSNIDVPPMRDKRR